MKSYNFIDLLNEISTDKWRDILNKQLTKRVVVHKDVNKALKVLKKLYLDLAKKKPEYDITIRKAYESLANEIYNSFNH